LKLLVFFLFVKLLAWVISTYVCVMSNTLTYWQLHQCCPMSAQAPLALCQVALEAFIVVLHTHASLRCSLNILEMSRAKNNTT